MKWNVKNIAYLYQPDVFKGTFSNPKMQERHEREVAKKLEKLVTAISKEANPLKAMNILHKKDRLQFLLNNTPSFQLSGDYEEALLTLYLNENGPFVSTGDAQQWNELFLQCDTKRLSQLGSQLPFDNGTVYRGSISGFKKSICWSPEKKNVDYLLKRWSDSRLSGGELFEVDITVDNVMVYLEDPREPKVLLTPEFIASAKIRNYSK
jgi:hypothetical protein